MLTLFPHSTYLLSACTLATSLPSKKGQTSAQKWAAVRTTLPPGLSAVMRGEEGETLLPYDRSLKTMQFGWFGDHTFWASDLAVLFPMSRARQNRNSLKASSVFPRLANAWPFLKWPCNETQPSLQPLFLLLWELALRTRWSDRSSKESWAGRAHWHGSSACDTSSAQVSQHNDESPYTWEP